MWLTQYRRLITQGDYFSTFTLVHFQALFFLHSLKSLYSTVSTVSRILICWSEMLSLIFAEFYVLTFFFATFLMLVNLSLKVFMYVWNVRLQKGCVRRRHAWQLPAPFWTPWMTQSGHVMTSTSSPAADGLSRIRFQPASHGGTHSLCSANRTRSSSRTFSVRCCVDISSTSSSFRCSVIILNAA